MADYCSNRPELTSGYGVGWISGAQSTFRDLPLMVDFASLIHPTVRQFSPVGTLVHKRGQRREGRALTLRIDDVVANARKARHDDY